MPDFERLGDRRAHHPAAVAEAAASRERGALLNPDGRLVIVAADHPARGALGVRGVADAMADRYDLLRRLVITLERPGVDGVLGAPDIIEDLLLLGALERKIVIGSMNRGGLPGATFELDDRFTGYNAATLDAMGFDGGMMLARIDLSDAYWVGTSAYTWLKLPVVDDMKLVMAGTTLPALLLGGDPSGDPEHTYAQWKRALDLPGVRGLLVGRALLYPPDDDVAAAVDAAVSLVRSVPA
jgi:hypothetical protein